MSNKCCILLALLLAGMLLFSSCSAGSEGAAPAPTATAAERTSGVGFYFDTVVTIVLYGAPEGLLDEIWADCARYEQLLSKTIQGSDVDRINHAGGQPVQVDHETWEILRRAVEVSDSSGHDFSVTIAPLTALWDFTDGTNRMPTDEERLAALPLVNDDLLVLGENDTVTLPEGMEVDLGGIAKGYIADQIAAAIRGRVLGATLNFGGNVYAVGIKPDASPFRVGIRDPQGGDNDSIAVVSVSDLSVVTSGIYERYFELNGVRYHHILDPETGISSDSDLASATIISKSSMTADAMATACIVMGRDKALQYLAEQGMDGLLITRSGEIVTTDGFEDLYSLMRLK
ncbi:MAG: FAD:protein FMN transferase [Clostridia bacterium]|nr:FAD:protein FMN transferase [Clostridia bacterium]MBR0217143.1 FAD:protein FMN transferase [Clostridia bacterium]